MSDLPISVCLIAKNEGHRLKRCLESVRGWTREIVVVINDCTDDTAEVATSFGAVVAEHAWSGFKDQKNYALGLAKHPWVLVLDADEEVSPELREEIRRFVERDDSSLAGADSPRLVRFLGQWIRHGDWYPDRGVRLVRKGKGCWSGVHDHCKLTVEGRVHKLGSDLYHYPFDRLGDLIWRIPFHADNFLQTQLERGKTWSPVETVFRAVWRFVRGYFLRLGFLDGYPGLVIAVTAAYYTFARYSRLYEYEKSKDGA